MKLFTDVKIGRRLAIGFGITLALMGVIAVSGYSTSAASKVTFRITSQTSTASGSSMHTMSGHR